MSKIVSIGDAKSRLSELIRDIQVEHVIIVRNSRPVAVLLDFERYEELMERLDDAEDALAARNAPGDTINLDEIDKE